MSRSHLTIVHSRAEPPPPDPAAEHRQRYIAECDREITELDREIREAGGQDAEWLEAYLAVGSALDRLAALR